MEKKFTNPFKLVGEYLKLLTNKRKQMEIFQEMSFTAQLYSCPKGWENEQSLLAFAISVSEQDGIQSDVSWI